MSDDITEVQSDIPALIHWLRRFEGPGSAGANEAADVIESLLSRLEQAEAARADAWDEGAKWAAVECAAIDHESQPWLAAGDNPYRAASQAGASDA